LLLAVSKFIQKMIGKAKCVEKKKKRKKRKKRKEKKRCNTMLSFLFAHQDGSLSQ